MHKHRVIIGWLFEGVAMLLAVFMVFFWKKAFSVEVAAHMQYVVQYTLVFGLVFCAVGLTLLLDYRHSAWVCLPFSLVMLFSFPLGTFLGAYYLWYFWKFVHRSKPG